jgi:vacuolar-type H+-ATPase subunit E/Vma4
MALMGSLALGLALAFGLGGRDLAAQALQSAQDKGKEQKDQVKQDFQKGRDQAQQDAQQARDKAQERMGSGGSESPSTQRVQTQRPPAPER